jgi:hypothetical protein
MYAAQSGIANAGLRGQAIGDIATVMSETWKEGRKSNYAPDDGQTRVGEDDRRDRAGLGG